MVARLSSVFKDGRGGHAVEFTTTSTGLYDACDEGRGSGASQPSAVVDLDSVRAQVPHRLLASPPASLLRAQRCRLLRFHELLSTITHASPRDLLRSHFVSVASQIYRVNVCSGISWTSSLRWASAHSASSGTGLGSAQHCACRSKQAVLSLQRLDSAIKKKKNVQGARHSTRTCTRVFPESRADRTVRAERTLRRKPQWINELTRPCDETVSTISERTLTLRTRFNSLSLAPPRSPQLVPWRINFAH